MGPGGGALGKALPAEASWPPEADAWPGHPCRPDLYPSSDPPPGHLPGLLQEGRGTLRGSAVASSLATCTATYPSLPVEVTASQDLGSESWGEPGGAAERAGDTRALARIRAS